MADRWTFEELLALLGTSKKIVETSQESLERVVELLNGASVETDPAHSYDEIALRAMQGLLASGVYTDDPGGTGVIAWTVALPGFLRGKGEFLERPGLWLSTAAVAPAAPSGV